MKLRILLVDDHQMFREALRSLLERNPELEVVAETNDGSEVMRLVQKYSPHIVCMDIGMPGVNGIEVTRQLIAAFPEVKVIAVSTHSDQKYVVDMIDAGASAYVTKSAASDELLRAIIEVRNNGKYLCPDAAGAVTTALARLARKGPPPSQISARERQVLQLVAKGNTSAQIADSLCIAVATVDVHRRNIMRKLNLRNVADLTRYAISHGISPDSN